MNQRIVLKAPIATIALNAGEEGAVVVGELRKEGVDVAMGFDEENSRYTDMFETGIIDPTKVTRSGIVDAASVARLLISSETMIVDKPDPAGAGPPVGMLGGMGGMPGMM